MDHQVKALGILGPRPVVMVEGDVAGHGEVVAIALVGFGGSSRPEAYQGIERLSPRAIRTVVEQRLEVD